jgi:uncharacterized protein YjbI with pentapeptide repeats
MLPRLLEEEVAELLATGEPANVFLTGRVGVGKSTALAHLAAVFANEDALLLKDNETTWRAGAGRVTVSTTCSTGLRFELQPWTDDDVVDYLLAAHRAQTGRVLQAWRSGAAHDLLDWPGACRMVLDELAVDDTLASPRDGVIAVLGESLANRYSEALDWAIHSGWPTQLQSIQTPHLPEALADLRHLLSSATVRGILQAEWVLNTAIQQPHYRAGSITWHTQLRHAITHALRGNAGLCEHLLFVSHATRLRHKPLVHSSLALRDPGYRPLRELHGDLRNAWLPEIVLRDEHIRARLQHANLVGADLRRAHFERCDLSGANLSRAKTTEAIFEHLQAPLLHATALDAADSSWQKASLPHANFHQAELTRADFRGANLSNSNFSFACLRAADLTLANLSKASLTQCILHDASLQKARLAGIDMREAYCNGLQLQRAILVGCNLAGLEVALLSASETRFFRSDLSATTWIASDLRRASFADCGLADVNWEGADLRGADFRHATFHPGNSRSGLLDSPIASEGSRTGYYTDESLEDSFQAPKSVRKANLRNCDLRGATIVGVDFYLVDLRGAVLDPAQREWLARCRAILDPH